MASHLLIALSAIIAAMPVETGWGKSSVAPGRTPEGLSSSQWADIRSAHAAWLHRIEPCEGGWKARNPGQQWMVEFDGRGFLARPENTNWTWGLELRRYGCGAEQRPLSGKPAVNTQGQRIDYQWDDTLQEWFINDARGIEHGFTVLSRPPGPDTAPLRFLLATRGCLQPVITEDARGVCYQDAAGATALNYDGLRVWDADGKILDAHFTTAKDGVELVVDTNGARYPLTIDPIAQQAYLKASNTGINDYFGFAVAVSGGTVVVGAPYEDSSATGINSTPNESAADSGAAYVFVRSGATWIQQAYLKASNTGTKDYFGWAVAVSGDTVVVGAFGEGSSATGINGNQSDNSAVNSGAAYVFVRNGTTWSQQAYIKASNADSSNPDSTGTGLNDMFGRAVAASGDTVVVGAFRESSSATGINGNQSDNSALNSGAAYVFARNGTTWSQQAYLKASNTGTYDWFGCAVAVSGDTAVVGAYLEDSSATGINSTPNESAADSGAAYVFVRSGTTWMQQAYLKATNTGASDNFGNAVAVSGDTVVVGAPYEDSSATGINGNQSDNGAGSSGAAYVFVRSGTTWSQQAYLKASNTGNSDSFGFSVAASGDTVVVGAQGEASNATGVNGNQADNSAFGSGAAYVFVRSGTTWMQQAYLKASNTGNSDSFGSAIAVSADTLVAGAKTERSSASGVNGNQADRSAYGAGAAYVFTMATRLPVVFIPGIAGSVLKTGSRTIWPTISPHDVADLHLVDGPADTVAVDVIRDYDVGGLGVLIKPAYGPFLRHLVAGKGYVEFPLAEDRSRLTNSYMSTLTGTKKPDLFVYPYDWRRSNTSHTATLHAYLQNISNLHGGSKVNLVVHSMGGLVMRRYLLEYGTDLVNRVVTVGSPIWGAPESAYRMFTGIFYNDAGVDYINSTTMKEAVLSMPAVHELNPSTRYLQNCGEPILNERYGDYNKNGVWLEGYDANQFRVALDDLARPQTPAINNIQFHGYLGGRQDDWSQDAGDVTFLHIIGKQAVDDTTTGIDVRCMTVFSPLAVPQEKQVFSPVKGEGDGTVPTLSAQRLTNAYAPGTIVRQITEPLAQVESEKQPTGQAAEHTLLMANTDVWQMIDSYLETGTVPAVDTPVPAISNPSPIPAVAPERRRILVLGCGRVAIRDAQSGIANAPLSSLAVQRIPGVDVTYNEADGWVLIEFDADRQIVVESVDGAVANEIEVTTQAATGETVDLARYRSMPATNAWQLVLDAGQPARLAVDANADGIYVPSEQIPPYRTASGLGLDMNPPNVELVLSLVGGNLSLVAKGADPELSAVTLRYQLAGGPLTDYTGPILLPDYSMASLVLYAEDATGNTSGLIRTQLNPQLSVRAGGGTSVNLEWPDIDGYSLQTATTLQGPWTAVTTPQVRAEGRICTSFTRADDKAFYRLMAQPVVR